MTSLSKSMPHCQYFDPKGVNFMTPMSKKKQCGQDYDKDVMIAGFPLLVDQYNIGWSGIARDRQDGSQQDIH